MEKLLYENDVAHMRARELRNLLVQKLGVESSLVNGILDREELKEMVSSILASKLQDQYNEAFTQNIYKVTIAVGLLTLLFMLRHVFWHLLMVAYNMLLEVNYKSTHKLKVISYNLKKRNYIAAIAMALSLFIEAIVLLIQLSIMLSWVLRRDHPLRQYMLPTLSVPVSASTLMGGQQTPSKIRPTIKDGDSSSSGGFAEAISNFSLDMGPMITIMALRFLIGKLEEFSSGIVLQYMKERDVKKVSKEDKKAKKKFAKAFGIAVASTMDESGSGDVNEAIGEDYQSDKKFTFGSSNSGDWGGVSSETYMGSSPDSPAAAVASSTGTGTGTGTGSRVRLGSDTGSEDSAFTAAERRFNRKLQLEDYEEGEVAMAHMEYMASQQRHVLEAASAATAGSDGIEADINVKSVQNDRVYQTKMKEEEEGEGKEEGAELGINEGSASRGHNTHQSKPQCYHTHTSSAKLYPLGGGSGVNHLDVNSLLPPGLAAAGAGRANVAEEEEEEEEGGQVLSVIDANNGKYPHRHHELPMANTEADADVDDWMAEVGEDAMDGFLSRFT